MKSNLTNKGTPILLIFALALLIFACNKESGKIPDISTSNSNAVFVLNEGVFSWSNASLSLLDLDSNKMYNNIFEQVNGAALGDVGQSMQIRDSLAYIVMNNSGRIYCINKNTFLYRGELIGLTSPREICFTDNQKAYISDLYNTSITIFNPEDFTYSGSINLGHSSESMLFLNNKLYVLSWSFGNQLFIIDTENDEVIDSVETGLQPNSMVFDKNEKLWLLCDGGYAGIPGGQQLPRLQCIDPISLEIEKDFTFSGYEWLTKKLCTNQAGDSLFFISGGIFAMSIDDSVLPQNPFIKKENRTFYGLGIQPGTSTIYASDARNYLQPGTFYRFTGNGKPIDSFTVGMMPGDIEFR